MSRVWMAAVLACAGCMGPPLPADPQALEAELRARAEILRDATASFRAEGTVIIDGPDRVKLGWRAEAVRGQWVRMTLSSALGGDPEVEVRVRAGEGLAVRVSPPGAAARVYRAPAGDLSALPADGAARAAAEWLVELARGEGAAMPSPSGILVTDQAVRLEFAHGPLASRVTLRRADGMPVDVDAWVRGDPGAACFVGRPRGDRAIRVGATPLSLAGDLETAVVSCCRREPFVSMRIAIVRLLPGSAGALPRWPETARPLERLADDRWLRPAVRDAELVRDRAARACPAAP